MMIRFNHRVVYSAQQNKQWDEFAKALNHRANDVCAEIARIGEREFTRRYETGPLKSSSAYRNRKESA